MEFGVSGCEHCSFELTVLRSTNASILGYASQNIFHPFHVTFHVTFGRITLLGWRPSTSLPFSSFSWASTRSRTLFLGLDPGLLDLNYLDLPFSSMFAFRLLGWWVVMACNLPTDLFFNFPEAAQFQRVRCERQRVSLYSANSSEAAPSRPSWQQLRLTALCRFSTCSVVPFATLFGAY